MKRLYYFPLVLILSLCVTSRSGLGQTGYSLTASYNHPGSDTLHWYDPTSTIPFPLHIRELHAGSDIDKDGKMEIIATDYYRNGRVHVFEQAGVDLLELVWSSPVITFPDGVGSDSSPREVLVTDLDADGDEEITFFINSNPNSSVGGIYVFEWDGVTDNGYGTTLSSHYQIDAALGRIRVQNAVVSDVDGDGRQEIVLAQDGVSADDIFYIVSVDGTIVPGSGGSFESWREEFRINPRDNANRYGGGSSYSVAVGDLNGDGKKEVVFSSFNNTNLFIGTATGPDTYTLNPDTSATGNRFIHATPATDNVTVKHLGVGDFDDDGNDEVYLTPLSSPEGGNVYVINYSPGDNVLQIDSSRVILLASNVTGSSGFSVSTARHGADLGDIFVAGGAGRDLALLRYMGGVVDDPANYSTEFVYKSDSTKDYGNLTIRDSAGVIDTVYSLFFQDNPSDPPFAIGLSSGSSVDFDNDGRLEVILGYQSIFNKLSIIHQTYNATTMTYDPVDTVLVDNPNARIIRVVENDVVTGVEVRDLTLITPEDYKLEQNYPNPFNPSTMITFRLPLTKRISLRVYDILGREVRTLVNNEEYTAGSHLVVWDGRNSQGVPVGSGTYFYRLEFGNFSKSMKMMLVK